MAKRTIVTMPGDGIGQAVLPESLRVLEAAGFEADYVDADIGWDCWCTEGNPLPARTIELLEEHHSGLFGAITSKPQDAAVAELRPELRDKDLRYYSPIVGLRQHFNLDVCLRPCRSFAGNPLNFIKRVKGGEVIEPEIDVPVFRQNTEGLYAGVEWTNPPDEVRRALETHPKMANFKDVPSAELAISTRIFSLNACKRIVEAAFSYAKEFGYKSVTVCEKPNVIRETSGMMRAVARDARERFPGIDLWETNIDAQTMWLSKNPEDYGVIVAGNMFGDIISDGFAGLVGGLGFAASANIGETCAVFEPTHGSAPKYADFETSIVNPIAMILSACMVLDHIGEKETARRIKDAIGKVVAGGQVQTYDMSLLRGSPEALNQGAASSTQMTDAVIAAL